jgi:hypothetical protein
MAIYLEGSITATGSAYNLNLGFIPSKIRLLNQTTLAGGSGVFSSEWYYGMPNGYAATITTAGTPVFALATSNGFTPFQTSDANLYTETVFTITNISQAANAVVTATNTLAIGDVVTFSGVVGMTQINQLRATVTAASGSNFTVNLNTSGFSAYTSGGEANVITTQVTPTLNAGVIGMTLGSAICGSSGNVIYYEAVLDAPFTS